MVIKARLFPSKYYHSNVRRGIDCDSIALWGIAVQNVSVSTPALILCTLQSLNSS